MIFKLKRTLAAGLSIGLVAAAAVTLLAAPERSRLGDEDIATLSIPEMVDRGGAAVRKGEGQLAESFNLLEESIAANDIAATTARNEAITAMKGLVKLSEQNLLTLQQQAAKRDRPRVEHEYVKITIAAAKVGEFYAQVKSATGIPLDLELTDVERAMIYRGKLPVTNDGTRSFMYAADEVPPEPIHASPYF